MTGRGHARRLLLTEGTSLTAREVITALGPLGYRLEICDPDPLCLARFSRYVDRVHRCPPLGRDPMGYLDVVERLLRQGRHDVLLPVHEQAFLLASQPGRVTPYAALAVADFDAFLAVQGKTAFARLLTRLGLPQPEWCVVRNRQELLDSGAVHHFVKAPYGTASRAVWRAADGGGLAGVATAVERAGLFDGGAELLVQAAVQGRQGQVQSVFRHGSMVAVHCTAVTEVGINGGPATRVGVDHPEVCRHVAMLGRELGWHGGLTLDYIEDRRGRPWYIEANPRLVEPMNATLSGVNLAEVLVRVSLDEPLPGPLPLRGRPGVVSHTALLVLLGVAARGGSRRALSRTLIGLARGGRGPEQATPVRVDPPSLLPLAFVAGRLLLDPRAATAIAGAGGSGTTLNSEAVGRIVAQCARGMPGGG